jgi:large subunit ribosomal protein L10
MNRQQKETVIADVHKMFAEAEAAFLVNYKGLSVAQMQSLRKNLRENKGLLKVTKANLMRLAMHDIAGAEQFAEEFKDQVGLVFVKNGEVPAVSKRLVEFSKENEALKIISGFYESRVLTGQEINFLASLPSREVLLGQLAGTLQAPMSSLARMLNQMLSRLAYVLSQVEEKKKNS